MFHFRISYYASVSTRTGVLIIGGFQGGYINYARRSSIVEFKDNEWTLIGNLKQARSDHQAILVGSFVMAVGGFSNDHL